MIIDKNESAQCEILPRVDNKVSILDLYFFTETMNVERYQDIIFQFITFLIIEIQYCWFLQDGTPAHNAASTI